jgi:hypothetical protein
MARPSVPHRGDPVSNRKPGSKIAEQTAGQRMQAVGGQNLNDKTQVQVIARAAAILRYSACSPRRCPFWAAARA